MVSSRFFLASIIKLPLSASYVALEVKWLIFVQITDAILSIWRPSEEVMQLLNEGSRLRMYHLTAAGVR